MGQFKPMVKMETTEPSVILKLKKGGKVAAKVSMESSHSPMQNKTRAMHAAMHAEHGKSPKKPSMSARRRAMNPNQYAKGGKVAHKLDGGMMGAPAAMPAAMPAQMPAAPMRAAPAAMGRPALTGMTPAQRAARAAMVRKALTGMKKGGAADSKCASLERELKHHESLSSAKAHKESKPSGYAMGGTIEGNEKQFKNTKMNTANRNTAGGSTGGVRMGNAGGFKKGGNVSDWENRPADTAKPGKSNTTTGKVRLGNAGGYSNGGNTSKKAYATGGIVNDGKAVKMPRHSVSRPVANSLQSGTFAKGGKVEKEEKPNLRLMKTHTGPKGHVAKVYKDRDWEEHRVKFFSPEGQHHPNADYHTETAEDAHNTAMRQVSHGYRKGGKARFAEGGSSGMVENPDEQTKRENQGRQNYERIQIEENKADKDLIPRTVRRVIKGVGDFFSPKTTKKSGGRAGYAEGGDVNWTKLNPTLKDKYNRKNAPVYSSSAVDKSIESSNRSGKKIGKSEASSIHRLLKGRD